MEKYIEDRVEMWRSSILDAFDKVKYNDIVDRTNPYLVLSIYPNLAAFASEAVTAWYHRSITTKYGMVLEDIAHHILGCPKSATTGVDIDIIRGECRVLASCKSGKNWGNTQSRSAQGRQFETAKKVVSQNDKRHAFVTAMVIFYGNGGIGSQSEADMQLEGQNAWHFITGDREGYIRIAKAVRSKTEAFWGSVIAKRMECAARITNEILSQANGMDWHEWLIKHTCECVSQDDAIMSRIIPAAANKNANCLIAKDFFEIGS
mgnify:CR=1 FL=1